MFGGVYCLRRNVQTLIVSSLSHDVKAIVCSTGQKISCSYVQRLLLVLPVLYDESFQTVLQFAQCQT